MTIRNKLRRLGTRRPRSRAYTMVEVMMGLAILAVGAAGIISLQTTALMGNVYARNLVTANQVSAIWVERLKADAVNWRVGNDRSQTVWLNQVDTNPGAWILPAENIGTGGLYPLGSPTADVLGADLYTPDTGAAFCTHIRLTPLYTDELIRVEVRTFWRRSAGSIDNFCTTATVGTMSDADAHQENGFVFMTTAVRVRGGAST